MAFPTSPTNGQQANINGITYTYSSALTAWTVSTSVSNSFVSISVSGNVNSGNVLATGVISASGNVSGGNLVVTGNIIDTGALTIVTGSNGNITLSPNGTGIVTTTGAISTTGNISANNATFTSNQTLSGGTANGVAFLNGSKVLTTGSDLVFDGTNLGIGTSSFVYNLEVSKSQDTVTNIAITNASAGVAAQTRLRLNNGGSNFGTITHTGASFTTSGVFRADGTYIYGNGTGGLTLTTGAATPIYFAINNSEVARIDSSGNVGIGTSSPQNTLSLGNTGSIGQDVNTLYVGANFTGVGANYRQTGNFALRQQFDAALGIICFDTAPTGTVGNPITFTQRMTLDASGNLGVGETSPGSYSKVVVRGGNGNFISYFGASTQTILGDNSGDRGQTGTVSNHPFIFITNATERVRIDSSGNLLVGDTTTIGTGGKFQVKSSTDTSIFKCTSATTFAAIVSNVENTSARLMAFQYGSGGSPTNVGTITTNGTGVTYGTSSDYRLKENIVPMTGALAKVALLKPCTYKWKADGSDGQGFIAHELQAIVPHAVVGEKDGEQMQGVDYGKLTPILTAALQEAIAKIETLEARIAVLETK